MSTSSLDNSFVPSAVDLAERNGDLIHHYFGYFGASPDALAIELKADETIVTRSKALMPKLSPRVASLC